MNTSEDSRMENISVLSTAVAAAGDTQSESWRTVMDTIQLILTAFGLVANVLTVATLSLHGKAFSPLIRLFLQHQSLVDSWVCGMAIILLVQPYMWLTGDVHFDLFLCLAWHGQGMYWGAVLLSIWNLVGISVERYMAVCRPFSHQSLTQARLFKVMLGMYILSIILLGPAYLQVRYRNGQCTSEYYYGGKVMEDIMFGYGIFWFLIAYAIPCCLFCILYGLVLLTIRQRQKSSSTSTAVHKANVQLTKTAVIVTVFFVVSLSWDSWFYILGYAGVVSYVVNSPTQKIGVFFSVLNSVANPFIYLATMPIFRISLKKTLSCIKPSWKNQVFPSTTAKSTVGTTG